MKLFICCFSHLQLFFSMPRLSPLDSEIICFGNLFKTHLFCRLQFYLENLCLHISFSLFLINPWAIHIFADVSKKTKCFFSLWLVYVEYGTDQGICLRLVSPVSPWCQPEGCIPNLVSCLANACLWSPGQLDNRVSVQIHHYHWASDWLKQWMSSVSVRGGALVLMLFLKQQ